MELEEIRNKKYELRNNIEKLIEEFVNETNVMIEEIEVKYNSVNHNIKIKLIEI